MELLNYRKFRDAKVEFPDGVVAIVGQNGTGKTTLLEAVTWALFGNESSVVRDGKEGVKSAGAPPGDDCSVVLEFELGEDGYRLVRSMTGKSLKAEASLEVNGHVVATGDTDVTKLVTSRLGMDHKAFFVSVFAKQKDLNALANIGAAERKTLVLRMLGVDYLDKVIVNVDRDARTAKNEAVHLSGLLKDKDGRDKEALLKEEERQSIETLRKIVEGASRLTAERTQAAEVTRSSKVAWETEEERYRQDVVLERRLTGLKVSLQGRQESLARLDKEVRELESLHSSLPQLEREEEEFQRARAEAERLGALREKYLKKKRTEEELDVRRRDLEALDKEREQAAQELAKMPDVERSLATVEASLESTRDLASSIASQLGLAVAEKERLWQSLEESKKKAEEIRTLGEDSNCPTCLRRLGEAYTELLQRYEKEQRTLTDGVSQQEEVGRELLDQRERNERRKKVLEDRRRELLAQSKLKASLEERLRKALNSLQSGSEKVTALEKELKASGPVEYDQAAHERTRGQVVELEPSHLALSKAQAKMERLPLAYKEREETSAALVKEEEETRLVSRDRKELNFDPRLLQDHRKQHEEARTVEEGLVQDIIRAEGEQKRLSSEMESLRKREAELKEVREKHKALMSEQEMLNRLGQVMKGFKENVISRIVPTLSEVSSDLLSQLTEGKYGGMRLDEEYHMFLYDQGEEYKLERFSGGETDLANLCLRLAISRMIMERSGSQMNFLVLDEIFGSQDQNRKRNILETLGQLQKQFRQILLITHIDDVKDNVSAVLRVTEKEDGSSTVVLED